MATAQSLAYTQTINGKRYYIIGESKLPSVTTVLGSMTDKSGLDAWRKRIGEEKANQISIFSANRGTVMHQLCEYFLLSEKNEHKEKLREAQELIIPFCKDQGFTDEEMRVGRKLFYNFYNNGLFDNIQEIVQIEETLYSHVMGGYAGRVDTIYRNKNGELVILDFKTSRKPKKREWIENYYLQISAYYMAYCEMNKTKPLGGEIWISNEQEGFPQVFKVTFDDIMKYGKQFLDMVKRYHELHPLPAEYIKI